MEVACIPSRLVTEGAWVLIRRSVLRRERCFGAQEDVDLVQRGKLFDACLADDDLPRARGDRPRDVAPRRRLDTNDGRLAIAPAQPRKPFGSSKPQSRMFTDERSSCRTSISTIPSGTSNSMKKWRSSPIGTSPSMRIGGGFWASAVLAQAPRRTVLQRVRKYMTAIGARIRDRFKSQSYSSALGAGARLNA